MSSWIFADVVVALAVKYSVMYSAVSVSGTISPFSLFLITNLEDLVFFIAGK